MQEYAETIWLRTRQLRIGFIAGLIVGLLAGWFFHGVISLLIRFFFVIVLLIPFVVAVIAWWRLRRQVDRLRTPRDDLDTRTSPRPRRESGERWDDPVDSGRAITVESWDTWESAEPRRVGRRDPEA